MRIIEEILSRVEQLADTSEYRCHRPGIPHFRGDVLGLQCVKVLTVLHYAMSSRLDPDVW